MRSDPTDAESILWQKPRIRRFLGYKFRRQEVFGSYIVDFACIDLKLIVELDGSQHLDQQDNDEKRSWYLCRLGYRVVPSWNNEALNDSEGVLAALSELVN